VGEGYDRATMIRRSRPTSALLAIVAFAAVGCSDDEEADPTEPAAQEVLEVSVDGDAGTCMQVDEEFPAEVEELPIIGCEQSHSHEIYATVIAGEEGDVYPGLNGLESIAQTECLTAFEDFVGISAFDSTLAFSWLVPTLDGWNDEVDREILCVLQDRESNALTGSVRGSRR
jgi:Septum formation